MNKAQLKLEINLMKFGLLHVSQTYKIEYDEAVIESCLEYFRDGAALILEKEKELKEILSAESDDNGGNNRAD